MTAKRSIDRYAEIEARSGIRFFTDAGYLGVGAAGSDYLDRCETVGRMFGADITRLDAAGIAARFPFLAVPTAPRASSRAAAPATSVRGPWSAHRPKLPGSRAP